MSSRMARAIHITVGATLFTALSGCATSNGHGPDSNGSIEPYGFFFGMWHGFIFPVTVCIKIGGFGVAGVTRLIDLVFGTTIHPFVKFLFVDYFTVIGSPNTGLTYFIGYLIGLSESCGGGSVVYNNRANNR